jgi:hypothetical protein
MKSCPKCNRTYDDSLSFCLEDGSILSASFSEKSTEAKTEIFNKQEVFGTPISKLSNIWKFAFLGLILLLTVGFIAAFAYFGFYKDRNLTAGNSVVKNSNLLENENSSVKTTPTVQPSPNSNNSNSEANSNVNTNTDKPSPTPMKTPESDTPDGALKKLKQGMSYAKARKMLADSGWRFMVGSPNRELFGQEEYVFKKLKFYEMETCSGTGMGFCRFLFKDVNKRKLVVVTANNEEGVKGGPIVDNWFIEK